MFVMLFKEIMLLSLEHEFRENDCAFHNLKGIDGCATCAGIGFKKYKEAGLKFSGMRCHITCSPITFMYTLQYTVLSNSHRLCYMKSYHIHVYFAIHSSITFTQTVLYVILSHSCILCNTQFYQIHADCAVCSTITFMYTLQ